ncbi:MAG TPA: efflux RND transporter periplasmic adaptor subunit, partial [Woeseiaceae bacterium]|nr:efflux RND transporter periplasmic adaptor subunit [Woeseiaceae bacterium]
MKDGILAAIAAGALVVLSGCETGEARLAESRPAPVPPLPVEVALPVIRDIHATFETSAALAADREALIPARVPGEVVEILVEEDDRVTAGQPLARLDGERLHLEMLKAKADLQRAQREYERSRRLEELGLISTSAFETQQFDLDALEATWELKRLDHRYTTIRATIPGVIAARHVKVGWRVSPGDPMFATADTARLVAELHIPQSELGRLAAGQHTGISVDAIPGEIFAATIDRISPTIDAGDGTFRATIYVDNRQGLLAPGMFGRFSIAYEKHAGALVVPNRALVHEDNEDVVYV